MATVIEVDGSEITYRDFSFTVPTSPVDVAPSASVTTTANASISANDQLTITIDGTTVFNGRTRSGGTTSELGGRDVSAAHAARDFFEETVSIDLTTPTTEQVLTEALSQASSGGTFTLDYAGSAVTLDNDYSVTDRSVKRVFRDIMDRTSRVWWVDPAGTTIHVEPVGNRGTWQAIDTQADKATLQQFDAGNVDTVRNAVTVVGTGGEEVRASAQDATSIAEYGRRTGNSPYNVSYVTTQAEAQSIANALLVTDPLPEGKLLVGTNVGDVTQPLANYTIDLTDTAKGVDVDDLVIEAQTIRQGRAELQVGAGSGVSIEETNRTSKSRGDVTEPGSVYGSDRLVDTSITEAKLADLAVTTNKLANNAVVNGKLDDLSVSETKIQDDSIATPKLQAEAVTASKIEADTITAAQIAAGTITALEIASDTITAAEIVAGTITALEIESGTITANEIAANTLTANNIDTLDLSTGELSISENGDGFFFDVLTISGTSIPYMYAQGPTRIIEGDTLGNTLTLHPTNFSLGNRTLNSNENRVPVDIFFDDISDEGVVAPEDDNTCELGTGDGTDPEEAFFRLNVHNINEYSPAPLAPADPRHDAATDGGSVVDLDELKASHWRDPPAYAAQEHTRDGDYKPLPERDDGTKGVEIGHLLNYTFEAVKELVRERDRLADRVDDLDKRLSRLEGKG